MCKCFILPWFMLNWGHSLKTLPPCPSQYQGHNNRFHSDYSSNYPEIAPAQRPVSVILTLALDPFDFMYLRHISQKRKILCI